MTATPGRPASPYDYSPQRPTAGVLLLYFLFWVGNGALALVTAAQLRTAVKLLGLPFHWGPYTFTLVDEVLLILLGLGWLIWVLIIESVYRKAAGRGLAELLRVVVCTTVMLVVVVILTLVEQHLLHF